jgi:hypothetical protein
MVTPRNEPDAPPSTGKKSRTSGGWVLLMVLAIVIIAGVAILANRPGSGMGGSLSREGGTTRPEATGSS